MLRNTASRVTVVSKPSSSLIFARSVAVTPARNASLDYNDHGGRFRHSEEFRSNWMKWIKEKTEASATAVYSSLTHVEQAEGVLENNEPSSQLIQDHSLLSEAVHKAFEMPQGQESQHA